MDELIEKLSLYDCLVRLITGGLVILITYYSGLVDTFWEVGDSSIIVFGFCSYGVGMILEEVSYMLKMRRKNNRNETCVYSSSLSLPNILPLVPIEVLPSHPEVPVFHFYNQLTVHHTREVKISPDISYFFCHSESPSERSVLLLYVLLL